VENRAIKQIDQSPEGTSDMLAYTGCCTITWVCYNKLFVTVHVDDILNTDNNK